MRRRHQCALNDRAEWFFLQSQSEGCDQAQQNRRITKNTVNYKIHQFHGVNPPFDLLLILEKLADLTFHFSQIHVAGDGQNRNGDTLR